MNKLRCNLGICRLCISCIAHLFHIFIIKCRLYLVLKTSEYNLGDIKQLFLNKQRYSYLYPQYTSLLNNCIRIYLYLFQIIINSHIVCSLSIRENPFEIWNIVYVPISYISIINLFCFVPMKQGHSLSSQSLSIQILLNVQKSSQ